MTVPATPAPASAEATSAEHTYTFTIAGMTCAACAARVQRKLAHIEGVRDASVNFATHTAQVRTLQALSAQTLAAAVEAAGYEAARQRWDLQVREMSCAACVARVERALTAAAGVLAASVNFATGRAQVWMLAGADIAPVLAALGRAGYPAEVAHASTDARAAARAQHQRDGRTLALQCLAACVLAAPLWVFEMGPHAADALTWLQRQFSSPSSVTQPSTHAPSSPHSVVALQPPTSAQNGLSTSRPQKAGDAANDAQAAPASHHASEGATSQAEAGLGGRDLMGASAQSSTQPSTASLVSPPTSAQNGLSTSRPQKAEDGANDPEATPTPANAAATDAVTAEVTIEVAHAGHAAPALPWAWQWVLALAVLVGPARALMWRGARALWRGAPDMNALIALGAGAAFVYSTVATFAPSWLPPAARHVYFESVATIAAFVLLGRWLEHRARGQASDAIERLAALAPQTAEVRRVDAHGQQRWVTLPIAQLVPGDVWIARPGQALATDGVVIEGTAAVDEAMLTGEAAPVDKSSGATVTGGTVNAGPAALIVRTTRVGAGSTLAQIIDLVERAQGDRLPLAALADRVTRFFVPAVMGIAALTWLVWAVALGDAQHGLIAAVGVLIVACPCAMGLAVPMAVLVGTGRAAARGVLFRRGQALQSLGQASAMAFDKTGTLTQGSPQLVALKVWPLDDENLLHNNDVSTIDATTAAQAIITAVASAQQRSAHPIARAWTQAAQERGLSLVPVTDFQSHTAQGISARVAGLSVQRQSPPAAQGTTSAQNGLSTSRPQKAFWGTQALDGADEGPSTDPHSAPQPHSLLRVGTLEFVAAHGAAVSDAARRWCAAQAAAGRTPQAIAVDDADGQGAQLIAVAAVADALRPAAAQAVADLQRMGLSAALISGDRAEAAAQVAAQVGIDKVHAPVRPADKLALIEGMQSQGHTVVFVGDGINDAPALARADVGIAMGAGGPGHGSAGTDIAAQAADVVLLRPDLALVPWSVRLARATLANMRQNLFWAFAYNAALIPLAAGVFTPWGYGLSPHWAAAAMAASSVLVTVNALRLRRV